MNILWLQHVPFEGLGAIEQWADSKGHDLSVTRLYAGDPFPDLASFAMLVVMGGPMGIYDNDKYPWLGPEKAFLKTVVEAKKPVLGICLGAQLLADVLGADVKANKYKEIGWFPIVRVDSVPDKMLEVLPKTQTVFHWHGDTFDLPPDCCNLYTSEGCQNQAFIYTDRVIALQFHLETTAASAQSLVAECRHELVAGPWIQTEQEITNGIDKHFGINQTMGKIMDYLAMLAAN